MAGLHGGQSLLLEGRQRSRGIAALWRRRFLVQQAVEEVGQHVVLACITALALCSRSVRVCVSQKKRQGGKEK